MRTMSVPNRTPGRALKTPWFKLVAAAVLCWSALLVETASASVTVMISNPEQRMRVFVDGGLAYSWPVSTARPGYRTPPGRYRVQRMERMWYSRRYDWSPMPHALFFRGGYAIHGTSSIRQLGRPASHGCVRLHPANARTLYGLVQANGGARIIVTDAGLPSASADGTRRAARQDRATLWEIWD